MINLFKKITLSFVIIFSITGLASAETTISAEGQYIFNTLGFYLGGVLVAFMAAGFCMLECGLVTTKSVSTIAAKNIGKFAIASIVFFLCGYNLAYGIPEGGYIGSFKIWSDASEIGTGYSDYSDWFYQAMFVCATVSIVSGAVAERIKIWPFFIFSAIMAAFIYPISMGWQWGGGWLATAGFSDFAGSTLVHACGGAAALAGVMVLGARAGRFGKKGETKSLVPFAASSIPLVTLGTFLLWFGWFGFNGFSQLAVGTFDDVTAISKIAVNTHLAGAAGTVTAALVTRLIGGKTDIIMMLNGALAGLVAITAEPLNPSPILAMVIGSFGAIIMYFGTKFLESIHLDDVVGAIPVHMFAGIFGTLVVPISNPDTTFGTQLMGVVAVCVFSFVLSYIVFRALKQSIGLRISAQAEKLGTDVAEVGVKAYAIRD
ncbi:ammonium transporter [Candidatus Pelagibacter bacterium]|jgi:Amt family ammonium transporter|nr:ammonium transporter [Candidatus Pelagibacter sp.]MDB2442308.1 ammonium transporter [Candidatus Pelagibacter bacterium]MDA9950231.1 ammonium transporter [Candidatus Pelagibacter sp.]MDB2545540.1 ammonium transporter [Candidatus Pelagibacter bacterium]MDB2647577.1 ammonium transporter [Candidatus Pelagibacter bacterium]